MWNTYQNCHREFDGAIFMCNRKTKKECLARGLFGLPPSQARFVQKIKSGMILFLFEYEKRKLFGVFEASSDGGIGIVPDAFSSSGKSFSSQVRIQRVWSCYPLSEPEFYNALKDNYYTSNKFHFLLMKKQVEDLIILFSSKKIKNQVSGDTEMHYWAMDQFKKHGRGMSPMNEDETSVEEKVSEEKVALTSLADLRHNFDICNPYFVQVDYPNKLHGQGSHSENENNSAPYRTVSLSAPCSDASIAAVFLGEDRSDLPQYSIPCLQYLQDPFSSEIEHYSKQALVEELTKPTTPGGLMVADDPVHAPYSRFNVHQMGMKTSDFSSCVADFSSSDPLVCWHGLGLQDLENVNAVDSDVHYQHPVCPSFYKDRCMKRTSAFERLSFTQESVMDHENNVDASAHDLIELLAGKRKRRRVPAHKKERAQHFCGTGKEHQTEQDVDAIVTLEVDDEACTSFEEADHGRRLFPNFWRRSDIRKESNNGGTFEEGDLKVDSCHATKRRKLIRPSLSKMPSSVEHVSEENKAATQAEAGAVGQCALHLLKQHSEDGACEGLQGSFQILLGPVGCINQNVIGQEQQKPLLQETGSNSGQLDVPQSALSVANTSGDHNESQFTQTWRLTPNPIICLGAQPEVNYQHLVDNEDGNLAGWSQAIQQESISNVSDNQDGNPILQAGPLTQNATVVLADQVVVKHGHLVHDGEGDLDELPETIQQESTLEAVEDQSKIVQSKKENQILHTGSLPHKTQIVLAEQAENKHRHLIHDGQGDAEELSQSIHQQSTAEDVRKDEIDLEQPQNGNQILQDESHPQNVKTSSADVKHNYLVHDGEGVLSELSQDTRQEISMMHVQKNQDIQLCDKEDQIMDTGSLSQEETITLAEAEISPENLTHNAGGELRELSQAIHLESRKANIGNDHSNLEQESTMVHGLGLQDLENVNAVDSDVHYQHPVCPSFYKDQCMKRTSAFERLSFTQESVMDHENNVDVSAHDLIELLAEKRKRRRVPAHKKERAQHFCGTGKEHQTEQDVDAIVTIEVDDEACTSFEEADHGRRQFPNFRRRSDIRKESNNGGTFEEGDLKVDSCHATKRRKLIRPSLSKMPSSVEHVSEENKAATQAEAGAVGQCALHLLKQHSEDGACEGLQGSFQILLGPVGCINQNVIGQEQQKPLLQETGSNSGQLDVPQSALSVANTSGDHDESQFTQTWRLTPNPIICLGAQPEVNYQHLVDNEDGNLAGWSQAIQQESISNVSDNQDGNPILQAGPLTQNATVVLADQVVVKHGHLVHDGEGDLDELPETIQHESTLEAVEDQSKIVQSEKENQILHTGSLPHKTQIVLAEQAENKHRHLIHDGQGDAEELSQAIHQQSTAEDVRKDEIDLEQPQNGNQILQDESHPRNVKTSSFDVKHNYLVHDGEGVLSKLSQDTWQEISMMHVPKNQGIQLCHKEGQIMYTGSLSQEEIITLAQAEISPENLTHNAGGELRELSQAIHLESRKANIGNDHSNLEQESTMVHGLGLQDLENVNAVDSDVHYQHPVCPSFYKDQCMKRTSAFERLSFTQESVMDHENNVDASAHDLIELLAEKRKRRRVPAHKRSVCPSFYKDRCMKRTSAFDRLSFTQESVMDHVNNVDASAHDLIELLSQEEIITLAEAEISPEIYTHDASGELRELSQAIHLESGEANIGNDHGNLEQTLQEIVVGKSQRRSCRRPTIAGEQSQ